MTGEDDRTAASSVTHAPGDLEPGTLLGGYRIDAIAGRGGMGVVYRATQQSLNRTVALKVIDPALAADPVFRSRFADESALAAALDHPNLIPIHEAGEDAGRLYVSMRLIPGTDLGRLLAAEGPLAPERAVALIAGVAGALDAAHAAGLVHRDVKPSNVLVQRRADGEQAYLSDFGVVKRIGADAERTGSAGWVGSADFVAPEQVAGGEVDGRSDTYALGAVLYTALTGQVPFPRPDIAGKLYASVNEDVPSVRARRPELPAALDRVIARATAKDPRARYATAGALATAAAAALPPAPTTAGPSRGGPSGRGGAPAGRVPRRWAALALAAVALVALVVAIVANAGSGGSGHHARTQHLAAHAPVTSTATTSTRPAPAATPASGRSVVFSPDGSTQLRVTLYDLRRTGPFVTLDFKASCVGAQNCDGFDAFGFHFYEGEGTFGSDSLAGIRLLDPTHDKIYRAVQDAQQNDWQSKLDISLSAPSAELLWVKFPAPPTSVDALDVLFSNGGPQVPAMPITTASAGPTAAQAGTGVEAPGPATFAKPPTSTDASGLVLPVNSLVLTVGNSAGAEAESATSATISLSTDVLFKFAKAALTPAASATLHAAAADIAKRATGPVTVSGYTDSIGSDAVNDPLSRARAQAVVGALKALTPGVAYTAHGYGSAHPVAPNTRPDGSDDPAGRALNRRVTISYRVKAPAAPAPPRSVPAATAGTSATGTVTYHAVSGSNYAVRVDHLVREGNLLVADFHVQCLASYGNGCNTQTDFGAETPSEGTVSVPPVADTANAIAGFDSAYSSTDAIYLQDAGGAIYDPVHDDANLASSATVANTDSLGGSTGPKASQPLWAYFPAPPANVTTLSFVLPGGKVRITGVPVTS